MGHGAKEGVGRTRPRAAVTAFVDTNILVRHLTGDPPEMAARATAFLAAADALYLPDMVLAEVVYVLEKFYEVPRDDVASFARTIVTNDPIVVMDVDLVLRALEIYEVHRLGFADAYLVASAEVSGVGAVASFDRGIDRTKTVRRVEPAAIA